MKLNINMKTLFSLLILYVGFISAANATCVKKDLYVCEQIPLQDSVAQVLVYTVSCSPPGGPVYRSKSLEIQLEDGKIENFYLKNSEPTDWDGIVVDLSLILSPGPEPKEVGYVHFYHSENEGTQFEIKYPDRPDLETGGLYEAGPGQCRLL